MFTGAGAGQGIADAGRALREVLAQLHANKMGKQQRYEDQVYRQGRDKVGDDFRNTELTDTREYREATLEGAAADRAAAAQRHGDTVELSRDQLGLQAASSGMVREPGLGDIFKEIMGRDQAIGGAGLGMDPEVAPGRWRHDLESDPSYARNSALEGERGERAIELERERNRGDIAVARARNEMAGLGGEVGDPVGRRGALASVARAIQDIQADVRERGADRVDYDVQEAMDAAARNGGFRDYRDYLDAQRGLVGGRPPITKSGSKPLGGATPGLRGGSPAGGPVIDSAGRTGGNAPDVTPSMTSALEIAQGLIGQGRTPAQVNALLGQSTRLSEQERQYVREQLGIGR